MITKFDKYKLTEDDNNSIRKLQLTIELFNLIDLIGGSVDIINKKIYYSKNNIIKNVHIKNDFSGNDLFAEIEDFTITDTYQVGFLNNLTIENMNEVYDYLKETYPDEYNQIITIKNSKKFNI